jgi:ribonuclease BN (tRNA processing enzyme)
MKVTLLGTGGPAPDPERGGQSVLVTIGDDRLLFDCGPGATHAAVRANVAVTDIDSLFLTHHHFDHIADLPHLVLARWDQGADGVGPLRIFGPANTEHICRLLFDAGGVYDADIVSRTLDPVSVELYRSRGGRGARPRPRPMVQDVGPGPVWSTFDWAVRATTVSHTDHLRCLGYRIDSDEGSVVISGDTVPCRSVVELARGADLLIHMAIKDPLTGRVAATPEGAADVAAAASVGRLALVHLGSKLDDPAFEAEVRDDVGRIYDGPLDLGRDGMTIAIGSGA